LGIDLLPLLYREVRIREVVLKQSAISIERDGNGKFNFEQSDAADGTLPAFDLTNVSLASSTLRYTDQRSGEGFEAGDCGLDIHDLRLAGGNSAELMRALSFT